MAGPVIAVCTPMQDMLHPLMVRSLLGLDYVVPRTDVAYLDVRGHAIEDARNDVVGKVLFDPDLARVTHFLWIDDDMVFQPDALRRLLAHDLPIVGGLCHGRRAPHYAPILCYRNPRGALGYTYRHEYPQGIIEVDATGAAFILVKREVYEAVEAKFKTEGEGPYSNHGAGVLGCGEDISFCERAKACGYKVMVDTTIEIGHVGEVVIDSAFAARNMLAKFNPWYPPLPAGEGKPVASIIIPTWNQQPEWLHEAVASALAQTVPCEVIVVDDGSDPPVNRENLPHGGEGPAGHVRLIQTPHQGCFAALNVGIKAMTTEWFTWLSSDDVFQPVKVERQLRTTLASGALASFHGYDLLLDNGSYSKQIMMPHVWHSLAEQQHILAEGCVINGLTTMIHRSVFDEVGLFDGERFTIAADWDLWNKIAQRFLWLPIPEMLATRREVESNASNRYARDPKQLVRWRSEDQEIRSRYAPRCPDCGKALR